MSKTAGKTKKVMKKNIIYLIALIVILALAVFTWQYLKQSSNSPKENSILVLPFSIDSADKEDDYLANGLLNSIIGNLARMNELKVVSRTTADQFKDSNKSLNEIAEELSVIYVMEGRILKQDDKIRIYVQLIDATTMDHIYAERFSIDSKNISDIATQISREVARNLE